MEGADLKDRGAGNARQIQEGALAAVPGLQPQLGNCHAGEGIRAQFYAIVRERVLLYGSIEEVDKKGQHVIAVENYKPLANLARKNGAIRATELGNKLLEMFEPEKTLLDPNAFLIPVPLAFSTDPAVVLYKTECLLNL
jgi:hypothetical protein